MNATETPNKVEIENRNAEMIKKDATSKKRKVLQESSEEEEVERGQKEIKKQRTKDKNTKNSKMLKTEYSSESSEKECGYTSVYSEDEGGYEDEKEKEEFEISETFGPLDSLPKEGGYNLVQFQVSSHINVYYLKKVMGEGSGSDVEESYLRKFSKMVS